MTILGFTGHRDLGGFKYPNPIYNYVYKELVKNLNEIDPEVVITGCAIGSDQLIAVICIRLGIPFIAAVPFKGQEKMWPEKAQKQYHKILQMAEEIIIVSKGEYESWKMVKRNKYIVNNSEELLAVFNGNEKSGTGNCVRYAEKVNKDVTIINPNHVE